MTSPADIPFQQLLEALLDTETPFHPRYLYRLSDLDAAEMEMLSQAWEKVPAWRRKALMEDIETMGENDYLLSYEAIAQFAIQDENPEVRLPAVRALSEFENPAMIDPFIDMLYKDPDHLVRAAVASALGKFVYLGEIEEIPEKDLRRVEDALLSVTAGSDEILVRRRALEALSFSSREEVPPLIEQAYNSSERDWLVTALFAMGRSANERWKPAVMAHLEDSFPAVRAEAARAAGELEITSARRKLVELLDDPDENVRAASIWSLSQIGGQGVRQILERLYQETDDDQEAEFIESALDNLAFTEDVQIFTMFDFPQDGDGAQADEDEDILDLIDFDDLDDFDEAGEEEDDDMETA